MKNFRLILIHPHKFVYKKTGKALSLSLSLSLSTLFLDNEIAQDSVFGINCK